MNKLYRYILLLSLGLWVFTIIPAYSRPYLDKLGICYYLVNEEVKSRSICIISTGYGTGVHFEIQEWNNGNKVEIYKDYSKSEQGEITVNGKKAKEVSRDGGFFHRVSNVNDSFSIPCFDVVGTNESFCSIFQE